MKVVSLIVCGVMTLPALAQESKPTPKPKKEEMAQEPRTDLKGAEEAQALRLSRELSEAIQRTRVRRLQEAERVRIDRLTYGALVNGKVVPVVDRHVAKVPAADQALLDIQSAAQAARTAKDLDATLKALDEIEKAVMRARAALHEADGKGEAKNEQGETKGTWKLP